MKSGTRMLPALVRVLLFFLLLGGGTGLLSSPAVAGPTEEGRDAGAGWCGKHGNYTGSSCPSCSGGSGSSSGGGSGGGLPVKAAEFKQCGTAGRLVVGTLITVPLNVVFTPLFLVADVFGRGPGFPKTNDSFMIYGYYGEAWGAVLGPAATGIWVGGKFIVYDAPVAVGGWVGPPIWSGVSHVFYVWPVAAGAWIGNGFRSPNVAIESGYSSLEKGDYREASRLFLEELRKDRADAAARRGLGMSTNALRNQAEATNAQVPATAPPAFMSSSGAGAGMAVAATSGSPGGTPAAGRPAEGYLALVAGSDTSAGRQLKSAVFTSSAAANSTTIEDTKVWGQRTFEGGGVYKGDLNPIVKVGRAGPPAEYRVPEKMRNEPSVARLNAFKEQERTARAAATAAQEKYEAEKRAKPGSDRLSVLLAEARIAQDRNTNIANKVVVQEDEVKKVAFEKFSIGGDDAPAPGEPPTKEGGK